MAMMVDGGFEFRNMVVRPSTIRAIDLYLAGHVPPGPFISAVLSNDLAEACGRADGENMRSLPAIIAYITGHAPVECWGSGAKVKAWLRGDGAAGTAYGAARAKPEGRE